MNVQLVRLDRRQSSGHSSAWLERTVRDREVGGSNPLAPTILALLLISFSVPAFAWGEKGHYLSNEAATFGLPTDMPIFFYKAYPELIFLAYDPDRWRGAGESLDAANPPDHFLDYEYVSHLDIPPDRYKFVALLGTSGTMRRYGISNAAPGFLPWKIAEMSELLTNEFRQWRFAPAGSREREFIERDIIHIAGILGHFAGDAANPHHATFNYNGWVLPNPNHYPNDCETHERFETRFVSHAIVLEDVTPRLALPALRSDYFKAAVEFIRGSNVLVETIYRIDRDGGFDVFRPVSPEAKAFTADRLAAGASFVRDLWWSAWKNSANAPKRRN
jgi:hypothetical protein